MEIYGSSGSKENEVKWCRDRRMEGVRNISHERRKVGSNERTGEGREEEENKKTFKEH